MGGRNMAETLAHGTPRAQAAPRIFFQIANHDILGSVHSCQGCLAMVTASRITIGETSLARLLWSTKKVDDDKTIDDHGVNEYILFLSIADK
ncbi:hypothetical protein Tco_0868619 [Tanacetum coccineum]